MIGNNNTLDDYLYTAQIKIFNENKDQSYALSAKIQNQVADYLAVKRESKKIYHAAAAQIEYQN